MRSLAQKQRNGQTQLKLNAVPLLASVWVLANETNVMFIVDIATW